MLRRAAALRWLAVSLADRKHPSFRVSGLLGDPRIRPAALSVFDYLLIFLAGSEVNYFRHFVSSFLGGGDPRAVQYPNGTALGF